MKATRHIVAIVFLAIGLKTIAQVTEPEPIAGKALTKEYITQNLVYPQSDLDLGNSGIVVVSFHVDKNGVASQYAVKSTFSDEASPVALHLVKTILWNPALNIGVPIEYDFEYEVNFNAKSYKRHWKRHERPSVPLSLEADTSFKIYEYKQLNEVAKPYFADGSNMGKYIAHNLKYPDAAKECEIQGTVRLSFVVETNGSVSNIVVVNSVGGGCDNEAIRLIQETIWIPAEKNGKYVRSANMHDITFNIGNRNFMDGNSY